MVVDWRRYIDRDLYIDTVSEEITKKLLKIIFAQVVLHEQGNFFSAFIRKFLAIPPLHEYLDGIPAWTSPYADRISLFMIIIIRNI